MFLRRGGPDRGVQALVVEPVHPWGGHELDGASGPLVYFGLAWDRAEEASSYAAAVAESMGLICFDVQQNRLRP
ncbi:hypothetical protein M2169_006081 [Streptomyces sp. MJP52]|nr:hypothetical protein [Streptomyces sp. MJP52]